MTLARAQVAWTAGPIPIDDGLAGKSVVLRLSTNVSSAGQLWTDSNGREMILRRRDARRAQSEHGNDRTLHPTPVVDRFLAALCVARPPQGLLAVERLRAGRRQLLSAHHRRRARGRLAQQQRGRGPHRRSRPRTGKRATAHCAMP